MESFSAYGVGFHRHNSEIQQMLNKYSKHINFEFTPHLSPMFRGILSTIYIDLKKGKSKQYNSNFNQALQERFIH